MSGRRYTEKEDAILKKYYDFRTTKKCIEIFKRNGFNDRKEHSLMYRAKKLGINNQSKETGVTIPEFCNITNANHSSVLVAVNKGKIKTIQNNRKEYIIPIDEFDKIVEEYKIFYDKENYVKLTEASDALGFARRTLKCAVDRGMLDAVKANAHWFITKELFEELKQFLVETGSARMNWIEFNKRIKRNKQKGSN